MRPPSRKSPLSYKRHALEDIGIDPPHRNTINASLARCVERDYRTVLATACWEHVTSAGGPGTALVLYDLTTLYFEAEKEDSLRKVGMSKERRVDPQITVGLLVARDGFPLDTHVFEGNKAETKTLIPVITAFRQRHDIADMVVVADAGMLSAANLNALEDAGLSFIVASRASKAVNAPGPLYFVPHRITGEPQLRTPDPEGPVNL